MDKFYNKKPLSILLLIVLSSISVIALYLNLKDRKYNETKEMFDSEYINPSEQQPETCLINLNNGILLAMGITNENEYNKLINNLKTIEGISVATSGEYGKCPPEYILKCEPRIYLNIYANDGNPFILQGKLTQNFQILLKDLKDLKGANNVSSMGITGSGYTDEAHKIIDLNDLDYYNPQIKGQTIIIHLNLAQINIEMIKNIEKLGTESTVNLSIISGRKINSEISIYDSELPYIPDTWLKMKIKDPDKTKKIISSVEKITGIGNFGLYVQNRCLEKIEVTPVNLK